VLDLFWGGRAAPSAYEALSYTASFRARQAPWLLALLALNVPLFLAVVVKGRWTASLRRLETGLGLAVAAVLAWIVLDGPVFQAPASDGLFKLALILTVAGTLLGLGLQWLRSVKPTPSREVEESK
jgi:hypothetical protein